MSFSQDPSKNSNHNNPTHQNQYSDYENNDYINTQNHPQEQTDIHGFENNGQSYEQDLIEQMYPFEEEDADEDLPNEIVAELEARNRAQVHVQEVDDSVFSDVVQAAFKKYQNEQDELYAQMEECWNYMTEENDTADTPKTSTEQPQESQLNPDAIEFKPSWLKSPAAITTNEGSFVIMTSSHSEEKKN